MYDVTILGGGPAGCEALYRLAKCGIQTILIERRAKGEGKPCGGALFQKEIELFGELPPDVYDFPYHNIILSTNDSEDLILQGNGSGVSGYNVKREIYDTYLMERAQKTGGNIRYEEQVVNVISGHNCNIIETNKNTYQSRFVFVALGYRGLSIFRKLGIENYSYKKAGIAVQKVLEGEHFKQSDTISLYILPELEGGYFWIFPKKSYTYVGCGTDIVYLRGKNLMSILDTFVIQRFGNPKTIRKEGGFVPHYVASSFYQNGFFFLGDSAGLANPIHGGGIFEARLSGKLAADSIEKYFTGKTLYPDRYYSNRIEKEIINNTHRWDSIMKRFLITPPVRRKVWNLFLEDDHSHEALSNIFSYDTNHFKSFKIIMERIFTKLHGEMAEVIRSYQERINKELNSLFLQDTSLDRLINYSLLGSGKRFRSSLVCLMSEAMGVDVERALPTALSYELAHTASLVHDDIIDEASKRRGKPSVVVHYGLDGAIVSGDALIMKAYEIGISGYRQDGLSKEDLIDLVQCATRSGIKTCSGELFDVKIGKEPEKYSIADYIRLIEQKTAALIEGPCEAAAILAGQKNMRSTLKAFGRYIGIAFQILDDAKDIFASEDATLKGRFTDFRSAKPNLYIIFILQKAQKKDLARLKALMARENIDDEDIQFIFHLCEKTGTLKSAQQLLSAYLHKANKVLDKLPDNHAKLKLRQLISAMGYWKNF